MSLLIERNSPLKTPGKRPFEEGNFQSPTNTPKFRRSHANAVRNFPRLCGPFAPENEQKSTDFFGAAAVSVALLRSVPPNHENIGENDAINEKFKKFRSDIERMKLKWGVLLGDYCKEGADDDLANLKNSTTTQSLASANEASKVLKSDHSICRPTFTKSETDHVSFGISNSEIKQMEEIMETSGKSIQDDDGCIIISEKSSNVDKGKAAVEDQNVSNPVIRKNSSKIFQGGEMSERHVFDWVEDNDNISCLSPSEWQNLNHKQSEKEAEVPPSETPGNESVPYDRDMEINVTLNNGQEVLNLYNDLYTKLSLEYREELSARRRGKQVHVKAAMILKKENKWVNINPTFGHVPGVEIGDQFQFRAELVVIGLHHEFICGINCTTIDDEVYANSIVDSGRYNNKVKSSDVLVYSGQGGNPKLQIKRLEDQKLERGNLALKNSMDAKFPIRVIRKTRVEPKKSVYIYDGLYNVTNFFPERSENGNMAYMFELVRMKGQPDCNQLTISKNRNLEHRRAAVADGVSQGKEKIPSLEDCNKLKISKARQSIKRMDCRRAVVIDDDLSQGLEKIPIMVVNEINDEKPPPFTYISKMIYTSLHKHSFHSGCNCIGGCSNSHQCSCIKKNRGEPPFNEKGALLRAKKMIFECGPSCQCSPSCENRVSQHGPKLPLEVFRTKSTGWGVRTRVEIPSGSFICEYLGELLKDDEADQRTYDEYLFDLDDGNGFTIDAAKYGNVGRFINHSCSPNLYAQDVLYDHDDKKLPHVMFFATKNIPALQELTYHYNYSIDRVCDANGTIRKKKCCCGSKKCIGRMY